MVDLLHNAYVYPALVALVLLIGCAHVYRHDSPALLLDGALAVAALVSQSVPAVVAALLLYVLRWHWRPTTASERQLAARAGWLLPGAARRQRAAGGHATTGQTTRLVTPHPAPPAVPAALPRRAWLDRVNRVPTYPHHALTGGTRLGKTTMETAILADDPGSRIVVCTPKAEWEDRWAGASVARPVANGDDPDWAPVALATSAVYQEMIARRFQGAPASEPIRLVLDEATEALDEIPALRQQLIRMLKTGASVGIRVTLIDPEFNVRAYGIEGRSDILASILVLSVDDARVWSIARGGARGRAPEVLANTDVRALASAADLSSRGWPIPAAAPTSAPPSAQTADSQTADGKLRAAPDELIELLYTAKGLRSREAMRKVLKEQYGFGLDNNRFTAVKQRLEGNV